MKALVDRFASGNINYETPDAIISEKLIDIELEYGQSQTGTIDISSNNGLKIKGILYTTDSHVIIENNQFDAVNTKITYTVTSDNMLDGEVRNGIISIVSSAGDFEIPFCITIKPKKIISSIGQISDLKDFVNLVRESYDEALILFLSKEFKRKLLKDDLQGQTLYAQVMANSNRQIAMEEFLVGKGLKERVSISVPLLHKEYMDVLENYGDFLNITRSSWGYVDIDVTVKGDFIYNYKEKISGEDFNGKIAEFSYLINASKLHGGENRGLIIFKTFDKTIECPIVVINKKNDVKEYIENKNNVIALVNNYLDFRAGVVDGNEWMDNALCLAEKRLEKDGADIPGLLVQAQVAILRRHDKAGVYLNMASQAIKQSEKKDINSYCYYLYLKSLYKNDSHFTEEAKNIIKDYFESSHDTWQLLWILFYMDERYDENPSLKYTLIKRICSQGSHSPMMLFEAAKVLNKQPELLRVINSFEKSVLNFAGKYSVISDELAKQAGNLMLKEKCFDDNSLRIMSKIYDRIQNDEVLAYICTAIIQTEKTEDKYLKWIKEGVEKDLKITNLYEQYIYLVDTGNYDLLSRSAYRYFIYGTETLMRNKDYFFANIIKNFDADSDMYEKYRDAIEKYATEQILKGNNNEYLSVIYNRVLVKGFVVDDMEANMIGILNTYQIKINNPNIHKVIVAHKELNKAYEVKVENGTAYIQVFTSNFVLMFVDNSGRVLSKVPYEINKLEINYECRENHDTDMNLLCLVGIIMENPDNHKGKLTLITQALTIEGLTEGYKRTLRHFLVDYYALGYDEGEMDLCLLNMDLSQISREYRIKAMEILIERNLPEMAYPYIVKYGFKNMKLSLLENLCAQLCTMEEYDHNEKLVEVCAHVFRNGCRNESVLTYLGKYYQAGSNEMYQLFLAIKAKHIEDNTQAEKMLVQYMFEYNTEDKIYDIFVEYLKGSTASNVRKAFYTYVTYNYFVKKVQYRDIIWELLEQEYADGLITPMICQITFLEAMSKRDTLNDQQLNICQKLVEELSNKSIYFQFFKKFDKWFKIPFNLIDKTIIDYRTNPKHKVEITYKIKTLEGDTKEITEEMGSVSPGIFTKDIIMFYGEEIDYSIKEYSDEWADGKVVEHSSLRISDKNVYNHESRFGMINSIMICLDLGREDAARELMQSYELAKVSGQESFKLL